MTMQENKHKPITGKILIKALDSLIAEGDLQIDHGLVCFLKLSPLDTLKPVMTSEGLAIRACTRRKRVQILTQDSKKQVALRCLSKERWNDEQYASLEDFTLAPACLKRIERLIKARDTHAFSQALAAPQAVSMIDNTFANMPIHSKPHTSVFENAAPKPIVNMPVPEQPYGSGVPVKQTIPQQAAPTPVANREPVVNSSYADKSSKDEHSSLFAKFKQLPFSLEQIADKTPSVSMDIALKGVSAFANGFSKAQNMLENKKNALDKLPQAPEETNRSAELDSKRTKRIKQRIVNLSALSFMGQSHPGPMGSIYIPVQIDSDSKGGLLAEHTVITAMPAAAPSAKIFASVYNYPDHAVSLLVKNIALLDSVLCQPEKVRKLNVDIAHQFGMKAVQGVVGEERAKRFHTRLFEAAASYIGVAQSPYTNFAALNQALIISGSARLLENIKVKGKDIAIERAVPILSLSAALHEQLAQEILTKSNSANLMLAEALLLGAALDAIARQYADANGAIDLNALSLHQHTFEKMVDSTTPQERCLGAMGLHVISTVKQAKEQEEQRPLDYNEQYQRMMSTDYRPENDIYVSKII